MAVVLHCNQEPGKGPNPRWKKFHVAWPFAPLLDFAVVHRTIGLYPGRLASCGSRCCCQGIGNALGKRMEQRVVDRAYSPFQLDLIGSARSGAVGTFCQTPGQPQQSVR